VQFLLCLAVLELESTCFQIRVIAAFLAEKVLCFTRPSSVFSSIMDLDRVGLPFFQEQWTFHETQYEDHDEHLGPSTPSFDYVGNRVIGANLPWMYHVRFYYGKRRIWYTNDEEDVDIRHDFELNAQHELFAFSYDYPWHPLARQFKEIAWMMDEDGELGDLITLGYIWENYIRQQLDCYSLFPFVGPKGAIQLRRFFMEKFGEGIMMQIWWFIKRKPSIVEAFVTAVVVA
jgi:hypothetical protein